MKAIRLDQPGQFARIDIPEPPAPAAGEAVVRVHRIGICGTDYGGYLGKMPFYSYPRVPGHELGVVDGVVKEPLGGAQEDPAATGSNIRKTLRDSLADLSKSSPEKLIAMRYAKFRAMGVYAE